MNSVSVRSAVTSQTPHADLTVTPEGLILFISEGDVWSVPYDGKETKRLTTGGGKSSLRVSKDGKKAFYTQNGELYTLGGCSGFRGTLRPPLTPARQ